MRNKNDQTLGELLREFVELFRLKDKLNEAEIRQKWEAVTGQVISRHTRRIYIIDRKLFVHVDSAALRQELTMAKSKLMHALNEGFEKPAIDDIVFK
jgi:predicted nucleic acid-binding Zn ribbon protein